jgi:hypothetical protein
MEETDSNFKGIRRRVDDWDLNDNRRAREGCLETSRTFIEGHKKVTLIPS